MKITIASRIFEPEASAASFRLAVLADSLAEAGHQVVVDTVQPPRGLKSSLYDDGYRYLVRRHRVFRDKTGYVRGYLQYLSFDLPLFLRLMFGKKQDLFIVEPPPTTGFFVKLAALVRRTPYMFYAADVWSDATASTGAPALVFRAVKWLERSVYSGAEMVFSVNCGVTARINEICPRAQVNTVGNGVNTEIFQYSEVKANGRPYVIYSGTASEWQGASVFIKAFSLVAEEFPDAFVVFLGNGSDWDALQSCADQLVPGRVRFISTVPPQEAAKWIQGARASLASIRPDAGYNFAFPTKVSASWASGTQVIYAGVGPVKDLILSRGDALLLGSAHDFDSEEIAAALRRVFTHDINSQERKKLSAWANEEYSLRTVSKRVVHSVENFGSTSKYYP